MPRLLAAQRQPLFAHGLDDVAVADRRAQQLAALGGQRALEPQVRHHRRHDRLLRQLPAREHARRQDRHDLVAVDDVPLLVGQDQAIGVAVQRDAQRGARLAHLLGQLLGVQRAALVVDVAAVRPDVQLDDVGAQLLKHLRRDLVRGAVRAVDDHLHAVQRVLLGEHLLQELDVAPGRVLDAHRLADGVRLGARAGVPGGDALHAAFQLGLDLVGQLEAVGREDLDAVVLVGVVRGADDDARVGAHRPGDEGDPGRRQRPDQHDVRAGRHDAGLHRALEHVARQARVLADDDAPRPVGVAEPLRDGLPQTQGHLRRHRVAIGDAPDSVRAEQLSLVVGHGCVPNLNHGPARTRQRRRPARPRRRARAPPRPRP